jgi:hypothetical protein
MCGCKSLRAISPRPSGPIEGGHLEECQVSGNIDAPGHTAPAKESSSVDAVIHQCKEELRAVTAQGDEQQDILPAPYCIAKIALQSFVIAPAANNG